MLAFQSEAHEYYPLVPAVRERNWMDASPNKYAYRCLPLAMANQAGWFILCPTTVRMKWNGGQAPNDLEVKCDDPFFGAYEGSRGHIVSHFGSGIVTFSIPYLFRTTVEGIGLRVDGPTNAWIPDVVALTGLVETWGHMSTFTMNWRVTAIDKEVIIPQGFPFCCLSFFDFRLVEQAQALTLPMSLLAEAPRTELQAWTTKRDSLLDRKAGEDRNFDGSYARHLNVAGEPLESLHWRSFRVPNFTKAVSEDCAPVAVNDTHTDEVSNAIPRNSPDQSTE